MVVLFSVRRSIRTIHLVEDMLPGDLTHGRFWRRGVVAAVQATMVIVINEKWFAGRLICMEKAGNTTEGTSKDSLLA